MTARDRFGLRVTPWTVLLLVFVFAAESEGKRAAVWYLAGLVAWEAVHYAIGLFKRADEARKGSTNGT